MRSQAVVLLAALAGSAASASLPVTLSEGYVTPDLGDGIFTADFGPNGLVNVTRIADLDTNAAQAGLDGLARRDFPMSRYGCTSVSSNTNDWEIARSNFKTMCNQGIRIPKNGIRYAVRNNHVAFGCSWGGENPCSGGEYDQFLVFITDKCGSYRGGWVDFDSWKKQYGMQQRGENICGHPINWEG